MRIQGCTNTTFSPWTKYNGVPYETAITTNLWMVNATDSIVQRSETTTTTAADEPSSVFAFTYMYYSVLGTVITIAVGTLVSFATRSDSDQYETRLLHPFVLRLAQFWEIPLRNTKECSASTFSIASCATTTTTTTDDDGMVKIDAANGNSFKKATKNGQVAITVSTHPS